MALLQPPAYIQGMLHPAAQVRLAQQALQGGATGLFPGGQGAVDGAHGVVSLNDFKVTANGTPNWSVNIATGNGFVRGTEQATQGAYAVYNDQTANVAVPASDASNATRHVVGVRIRDHNYSGLAADDGVYLTVVSASPGVSTDPALPANFLPLARIVVPAAAANVQNAHITDLRAWLPQPPLIVTSATRPTTPVVGQRIWETDTKADRIWDGTRWNQQSIQILAMNGPAVTGTGGTIGDAIFKFAAGSFVFTSDAAGEGVVGFGSTFPNGIVTAVTTIGDNTANNAISAPIRTITKTQMTVRTFTDAVDNLSHALPAALLRNANAGTRVNFLVLGW